MLTVLVWRFGGKDGSNRGGAESVSARTANAERRADSAARRAERRRARRVDNDGAAGHCRDRGAHASWHGDRRLCRSSGRARVAARARRPRRRVRGRPATLPWPRCARRAAPAQDKAKLRIGRQLLDGAAVPLKKPQAVLVKVRATSLRARRARRARRRAWRAALIRSGATPRRVRARRQTPAKDGHGTVYTVVGVIRRKVSFTTRPNPAKPPALPPPPPCERQEAENRAPLAAAAHGCDRDTQVTTQ